MRAPAEMAIKGVYKKNDNKNGVSCHSSLFYPFLSQSLVMEIKNSKNNCILVIRSHAQTMLLFVLLMSFNLFLFKFFFNIGALFTVYLC